jgi:hypothetical protein
VDAGERPERAAHGRGRDRVHGRRRGEPPPGVQQHPAEPAERPRAGAGPLQPCNYAGVAASGIKATPPLGQDGTTIFSLAYGAGGSSTSDARCLLDWSPSPFAPGATPGYATTFFATVASPLSTGGPSTDNLPGGCATNENTDGDFYFCEERGDNLSTVFLQIATATMQHSQLVNF